MADALAIFMGRMQGLQADVSVFMRTVDRSGGFGPYVADRVTLAKWRAQVRGILSSIGGPAKTYMEDFNRVENPVASTTLGVVEAQIGIARAAEADLESGYMLRSARVLIQSELLANLSDQALILLEGGYVAAATSVAGAELEQGLRAACEERGVTLKAKEDISSLATKLAQAGHVTTIQQRQIATWKGLRDLADHGLHEQLVTKDVEEYIAGIQRFLADVL